MFKEFRTLDWAGVSVPLGVQKAHLEEELGITFRAFGAGWRYDWQSDGMLSRVVRPDGKEVSFAYDALGRRTEKTYEGITTHFVWDGNVPLHEWQEVSSNAEKTNITTWLFEQNTFIPAAKLAANGESFSIVSDYLGTPLQAFDNNGNKVWEQELDIFGRKKTGNNKSSFIPFKYQGQYEDVETGLYYNRFRYYDPRIGNYISQDPIRLMGNNPTLYGYVSNSNVAVDPLGLMAWGEFMNGASATITAGGHSGVYHSSTAGHAEINGLNDFANKGWLNGQDVTISDVTGHFSIGDKPVGVCSKCRSDIFGILAENGANSVTLPVTKGNVQVGEYKINSDNFIKVQSEIDKINKGTGTTKTKSDNAWEVLKKYSCK